MKNLSHVRKPLDPVIHTPMGHGASITKAGKKFSERYLLIKSIWTQLIASFERESRNTNPILALFVQRFGLKVDASRYTKAIIRRRRQGRVGKPIFKRGPQSLTSLVFLGS